MDILHTLYIQKNSVYWPKLYILILDLVLPWSISNFGLHNQVLTRREPWRVALERLLLYKNVFRKQKTVLHVHINLFRSRILKQKNIKSDVCLKVLIVWVLTHKVSYHITFAFVVVDSQNCHKPYLPFATWRFRSKHLYALLEIKLWSVLLYTELLRANWCQYAKICFF